MATRLFVSPEQLAAEVVVLTEEDHRYLTRVLRMVIGDEVTVFDGIGVEATTKIIRIGPRALELKVEERHLVTAPDRPELSLIQGLAKGDKFDFVVQKATELGVGRITPVTTARAIPRPFEAGATRAIGRRARWQKIAREASRQSGRADVPEIEPVSKLEHAVQAAPKDARKIMLWEGARQFGLRAALEEPREEKPKRIVLVVGPEGGFTTAEVEVAREAGFLAVGLGPRVLRTETAALVGLSILGYLLGDLG